MSKAFYDQLGYNVTCLDIDKRFEDLPGFVYFDLANAKECQDPRVLNNKFEIIKSNRINLDMPENDGEMMCYENN